MDKSPTLTCFSLPHYKNNTILKLSSVTIMKLKLTAAYIQRKVDTKH